MVGSKKIYVHLRECFRALRVRGVIGYEKEAALIALSETLRHTIAVKDSAATERAVGDICRIFLKVVDQATEDRQRDSKL